MKTRKGNSCKLVSYNQHHAPGYPEHFEQLHEGNTCFVHVDIMQFAKSINPMNDEKFMKFVEKRGGLKTGVFPGWGDKSHRKMNMDSNDTFNGGSPYDKDNPTGSTKHEAARSVAQKELNKLAKEYENQ